MTRNENKVARDAGIGRSVALLFFALTLVNGSGCATSKHMRATAPSVELGSTGTRSIKAPKGRKRIRSNKKNEIDNIAKSEAEKSILLSATAAESIIESEKNLTTAVAATPTSPLRSPIDSALPIVTASPVANPKRQEATLDSKSGKRFRTLSPEVPIGITAADETVTAAGIQSGQSKQEKLNEAHLIFDFPVTYNSRVRKWIRYFQTTGRSSFRRWLERSTRYIPFIQNELKNAGLPTDIAYVAMIESGFSSSAISHANAMGMWQFIVPTGERYGLNVEWWIDERRDYEKATKAAIGYMSDLFEQFGSWYLVAASYNMGEGGVRRLIKRHGTNSFWDLADRGALPEETRNYVPKMLAAMLIAKAPALYGFRELEFHVPFAFESYNAPGGTDLINLANHLGVSERSLTELNPELLKGFIPREVKSHRIRIPKGSRSAVAMFLNQSETVTQ